MSRFSSFHCSISVTALATCLVLAGCAAGSSSNNNNTPQPTPTGTSNLTGNWQGEMTPQSGGQAILSLAGSITQAGSTSSAGQFTSSLLKIGGDCFATSSVVPFQGQNNNGALAITSYDANGQSVVLNSTFDAATQAMAGTYAVYGGCADGARGSFTAMRYSTLSGTFQGVLQSSTPVTVTAMLSQVLTSTGDGTFLLTGDLKLQSSNCNFMGTAAGAVQNYVQGNSFQATFSGSGGGSFTLSGKLDPAAQSLTEVSLAGTSPTCPVSSASGSLAR